VHTHAPPTGLSPPTRRGRSSSPPSSSTVSTSLSRTPTLSHGASTLTP
jgi:hypothetical protein